MIKASVAVSDDLHTDLEGALAGFSMAGSPQTAAPNRAPHRQGSPAGSGHDHPWNDTPIMSMVSGYPERITAGCIARVGNESRTGRYAQFASAELLVHLPLVIYQRCELWSGRSPARRRRRHHRSGLVRHHRRVLHPDRQLPHPAQVPRRRRVSSGGRTGILFTGRVTWTLRSGLGCRGLTRRRRTGGSGRGHFRFPRCG